MRKEPSKKRTLGIIGEDGSFSNLGLLLSDQCVHTIEVAVFEGSTKTVFKDRAEFSGLKRIDMRDYPPEAILPGPIQKGPSCEINELQKGIFRIF